MSTELEKTNNAKVELVSDNELLMHLGNLGLIKDLTEGEKNSYLQIAKAFNLNPFKREIHVSKYNGVMSIITGYEVYIKRAERSGLLDGWECTTEGSVEKGDLKGILTIYRKDRKYPFKHEVDYSEYVQTVDVKVNGQITGEKRPTKFWLKAKTMIKKVAISQGFRLCFSDELGGMPYTKEEMPETENISHEVVYSQVQEAPQQTWEQAESLLSDVSSVEELTDRYKSLSPELKKDKRVIDLCAEIKLHFTNPVTNAQ